MAFENPQHRDFQYISAIPASNKQALHLTL